MAPQPRFCVFSDYKHENEVEVLQALAGVCNVNKRFVYIFNTVLQL